MGKKELMPEPADPPPKPLRTWRPMILWTAAILLALGLAWFVGAVAVPVWQGRSAIPTLLEFNGGGPTFRYPPRFPGEDRFIARLGGPESTAAKLGLYLRMPSWIASDKVKAVQVLGNLGERAVPALTRARDDPDPAVRKAAESALARTRGGDTVILD